MKQTVTFYLFDNEFRGSSYEQNFSYEGRRALFEYLETYESDTGEELELDIVGLCCDFTEYEDIEEFKNDYPDYETMDDIVNATTVILIGDTGRFIIQDF